MNRIFLATAIAGFSFASGGTVVGYALTIPIPTATPYNHYRHCDRDPIGNLIFPEDRDEHDNPCPKHSPSPSPSPTVAPTAAPTAAPTVNPTPGPALPLTGFLGAPSATATPSLSPPPTVPGTGAGANWIAGVGMVIAGIAAVAIGRFRRFL